MTLSIPSTRLRDRVRHLVNSRHPDRTTLSKLASDCGLPLPWLIMFASGDINEPSVNRMECLWEHLNGKRLKVD